MRINLIQFLGFRFYYSWRKYHDIKIKALFFFLFLKIAFIINCPLDSYVLQVIYLKSFLVIIMVYVKLRLLIYAFRESISSSQVSMELVSLEIMIPPSIIAITVKAICSGLYLGAISLFEIPS